MLCKLDCEPRLLPISLLVKAKATLFIGGGKATKSVTHRSLLRQDSDAVLRDLLSFSSGVHSVMDPSCDTTEINETKLTRMYV